MENKVKISTQNLNLYYGENHALKNINLDLYENKITAFIGPSGCGKSTYLKTLNRMNDLVPNVKIEGTVLLDNENIYDPQVDTTLLRKKVGMVFQQPNPFPMSIYDNIAYGPRIHGIRNKAQLDEIVERSLKGAALWDEVSDRLKKSALGLSGGQQHKSPVSGGSGYSVFVILHHNWILSAFLFLPDNSFLRFCCFFYYLWLYFSTYSARSKHPFFLLVKNLRV